MLKIQIVGKFYTNQSLSGHNRYLAETLKDTVDLRILPLDNWRPDFHLDNETVNTLKELTGTHEKPDIELRHSYPPVWHWPENKDTRIVYIQPWEFMSIPLEWQHKFETFSDLLVTPSSFCAKAFLQSGLNPERLKVIPVGYNPNIFHPVEQKRDKIRFLFVGCHQFRKGIDVLLNVWQSATNRNMPIELYIKDTPQVYGANNLLQDILKIQYQTKCAPIVYDDSSLSEQEMATLYQSSDILVHPYRGEGFGMPVQEAMACGCVPIVTDGGSTDDFVSDFRIQSSQRIVDMRQIFALKSEDSTTLMGHHKWVLEPDAQHLAELMQHVASNLEECKNQIDTSRLTTWDSMSRQYVEAFDYLLNTFDKPRRVR